MYYLNINDDDFIKTVCKTAFPNYNGRKLKINYNCKQINLRSYWDGGSKSTYVILRLDDNKTLQAPVSHPFFNKSITGVDNFVIPENYVVVQHSIFCGKDMGLTIHTPSAAQLLNDGSDNIELTRVQKMVLCWIVGLKSAYRKQERINSHFPEKLYNIICKELESMELIKINKNGAVQNTLKARNLIQLGSQNNDGYAWWSQMYDWKTRSFSGEAKTILESYKTKYNLK